MARITVEDCLDQINNRFQLVLIATKRARQIARGSKPLLEEENDKPTVLALREIAEGRVDDSILEEEPEVFPGGLEPEAEATPPEGASPEGAAPQPGPETDERPDVSEGS